ncbi:MAG: GntR family transcriptional regulator [Caldimonas sp.]
MTDSLDDQTIYLVLAETLLTGRLGAGAKLGEQRLAGVFDVTRERIRKVLHRLGHERLIEVFPNRGAYVANPSLEDARQIYEARRILEGGIAWRVAESLSIEQLAQLRQHFSEEERAHARKDRAESIRLSGAFHVLLAEMTQNPFVIREMQELVSRTSMLVALMEDDSAPGCGIDEHSSILKALESRNPSAAARTMIAHLSLIETRLRPRASVPRHIDIEATLKSAIHAHRRQTGKRRARLRA